jgi:Icc-related predicted phosphoesterase
VKVVMISDTHEKHREIGPLPDGDLLIHAGDFTMMGEEKYVRDFDAWLGKQPHKHKVVVPGNHDVNFQRYPDTFRPLITNAHLLIDEAVVIDGIKVYGSPWTPQGTSNSPWGFEFKPNETRYFTWNQIPEDTNILVTHGPPTDVDFLDMARIRRERDERVTFMHVGDAALSDRIRRLPNIKLHVFGHIHDGAGHRQIRGIHFFNASRLDSQYRPFKNLEHLTVEI